MGSIQFQDIIRQQLEQLDRMAGMVDRHIGSIGRMLEAHDDDTGEETLLTQARCNVQQLRDGGTARDAHGRARRRHRRRKLWSLIELF